MGYSINLPLKIQNMENTARFLYTQSMDPQQHPRIIIPALAVSGVLFLAVILAFVTTKNRQGTIVLPGGVTYLGPTPTEVVKKNTPGAPIPVPEDAAWAERKGKTYPYSFSYPAVLSLGEFPNDPFDAVTVFHDGTDANTNIFFRVDNLTRLNKSGYRGNAEQYAKDWWKDYSWNGVASVTPFTNKSGLTGYRAKYRNDQNAVPYDHIFFAVPNNPELVIWMSGRLFEPSVFDRMVDSVSWKDTR